MKIKALLLPILGLALCGILSGQNQPPLPPATDTFATSIAGVIAAGARIQVIKDGFQGTEGPIAFSDGSVIFTEGNASRITKIDKDGTTSTFLDNTQETNSLAFDSTGRLLGVARAPGGGRIHVLYPKGKEAVLTDNIDGKPFGRPNDIVVDKKGGVYFTDMGNPPNAPAAVYYVPAGGKSVRVVNDVERPNGVQLSRDERTLFLANTSGEYVLAFDIQDNGTLRNRRNFGKLENLARSPEGVITGGADGLAIDNEGRVYAATSAGVQVLSPQGQHLGVIPIPRAPQNLAFAGADKKTLYVVGRGIASKVQMLAEGFSGRVK